MPLGPFWVEVMPVTSSKKSTKYVSEEFARFSSVNTEIDEPKNSIIVYCLVSANSKTGVEMEALSGVNSALLAIYDLSKIVEPNLKITNTRLLVKSGGKKGLWINPEGIPKKIKNVLNI